MSLTLKDTDRGYKALTNRVFGVAKSKPTINVGVLDGDAPHGDDAISVLQIAIFNEFGTNNIPARSFIRAWFDENEAKLREDLVKLMQSVVQGTRTKEQILELLGQRCVAEIQERISAGIDPPNAASTVAKKGSSTPLVNEGLLRSAISYRVDEGG
jgi:hypothetical protein